MRKDKYVPVLRSIRKGITFPWAGQEGSEVIESINPSIGHVSESIQ